MIPFRGLWLVLLIAVAPLRSEETSQLKATPPAWLTSLAQKHKLPVHAVSYSFIDLARQDPIKQFNEGKSHLPASLMKLPTCVFALEKLGADHRFETKLYQRGTIDRNGKLTGELYLVGGLDPILTATKTMDLALSLRLAGIKSLEGKFYYDDSLFESRSAISPLGTGDQTYNPGLSALSVEFNRFRAIRDAAHIYQSIPPLEYLVIRPTQDQFPMGQRFRYDLESDLEVWEISTKQRYQNFEDIPVRTPSRYASELFTFFARESGVELPTPEAGQYRSKRGDRLLHTLKGQDLLHLCESALEYSNNLIAEHLLIAAALKQNPKVSSLKEAADEMQKWLNSAFPELNFKNVIIENGSGLSLKSRFSADLLARWLAEVHPKQYASRRLIGLLSLAGQSGWIRQRFLDPKLTYRIFAKTGSLDFAHNLAGYYLSGQGQLQSFALLISDPEKRVLLENAKDESARKRLHQEAEAFRQAAHGFMEDFFKQEL